MLTAEYPCHSSLQAHLNEHVSQCTALSVVGITM